ncbi:probable secreted glycoprotein [Natronomonas moolapensis 8.8.11]|uniref:Probable secreted glycoprotein n=1 Tax=Natronomonas moolapensis (strain DSM 18674 / CECT 7526 / JCM 14361 / 8.8.11) TaxID=268739 RepID=M1XRE1_NATM8|nr:GLUG motif-containing protein [Natronomonas moolapensis]CCQ36811.1 probable secreted glycoprotein [Natronomonas moolapensis 8.8.11]
MTRLRRAVLLTVLAALLLAPAAPAVATSATGGSAPVGSQAAAISTAGGSAAASPATNRIAPGQNATVQSVPNSTDWPEIFEPSTVSHSDAGETSAGTELAVVDTTVEDHATLARAAREAHMDVVNVSSAAEMQAALAERSNLAAVHVLSHGTIGTVQIGTDTLHRETLDQYSGLMGALNGSLAADGDVLLYGCLVAKNGTGRAFVGDVANATGGDVAASDDLTGAESQGGDWELEVAASSVSGNESEPVTVRTESNRIHPAFQVPRYQNVLNIPSDENYDDDSDPTTFSNTDQFTHDGIKYTITGTNSPYTHNITASQCDKIPICGGSDLAMLFDSDGQYSVSSVKIEDADGDNFKLKSMTIDALADNDVTVSPDSGASVSFTSNGTYVTKEPYTFSKSSFENTQSVTISGGNIVLNIDDINFEPPVIPNNAPTFDNDSSTTITVKEDSGSYNLDSKLAVSDSDGGDTLDWSISSAPTGSTSGFGGDEAVSAGSGVTPSGMTYTPPSDTSGTSADSFDVQVSDGTATNTITVNVDIQDAPEVSSITRKTPTSQDTNANSVTYDVTFSESVSDVDTSDFTTTVTSGSPSPSISSVGDAGDADGSSYTVDVSVANSGDGTFRLDLSDDDTIDNANNVPLGGDGTSSAGDGSYISGESYTIDNTVPTLSGASKVDDTTIRATITDGVDVDESTIDASDFSLSSGSIASVTPSENGADATVDIDLTSAVDTDTVDVTISGSIDDTSGNSLTSGTSTVSGMDGVAAAQDTAPTCSEVSFSGGDGSADDPYEIENVSQLQCINADLDAHYELVSDVNASATSGWNDEKGFEPIGSCTEVGEAKPWERCSGQQFTGTFDGNSHTVSGLTVDRPDTNGVGLFAAADEARFTNLRLASVNITGGENTGGLAGQLVSDNIDTKDGFVGNVSVNGTVTGELDTAGVVGHGYDITLEDQVVFTGRVVGSDEVGGILGRSSSDTTVSTSYVRATVEADEARGRVHGDNADAGGLVGNSGNPSDFTNVYTVGSVTGDVAGSIVGGGNVPSTFEDVYWDTDKGPNDAVGGYEPNGVVTALSTAEMQGVTAEENMDFDWAGTWQSVAGDYPVFQWEAAAVGESSIAGIDAPDTTAVVNETGGVTVVATDEFGNRLESTSISVDATDGLSGINTGDTETTDSNGQATFTFTEETAGTYDLTFSADESITDTATVTIREGVNCAVVEYSGDGSTDDPYEIDSLAKLQCINQDLDAHYELVSDVDASATSGWNNEKGFEPIGNSSQPFTGTFDGNDSTISELVIDRPQTEGIGLFGHVGTDGEVRNATLEAAEVTGGDEVGVVVGDSAGSVTNVTASGNVTGDEYVGGVVGYADSGVISDSHGSVTVNATNSVGGLVGQGWSNAAIRESVATGSVNASGSWAGGLVGDIYGDSSIENSMASGNVNGDQYVGGLVGYSKGVVTNATAAGTVSGSDNDVGGLIGYTASGELANVTAFGDVSGEANDVGGLIGDNAAPVTNATASGDVSGQEDEIGGLIGDNSGSVTNATASGDVSGQEDEIGGLIGDNSGSVTNATASGNVTGDDEVGGLTGDDDASVVRNATASGNVTGDTEAGGLIGVSSGTVRDVTASGSVTGTTDVGGLIGDSSESVVQNATASGNVTGDEEAVGGLIGDVDEGGKILNSYATGDVSSSASWAVVGGLVGDSSGERIADSFATGNVTTDGENVGGLVGIHRSGNITNAYATGSVDGNASLGGLVGNVSGGNVTLSYAVGAVADEPAAGGLIGTVHNSPTVQNTYWDNQTTERTSSAGAGAQSLRTVELKGDNAKTNATGFDFQNTWDIRSGAAVSYPYLRNNTQSPPPGLESPFAGGTGSESSPFEIKNWYHLDNVSRLPGANYTLVADLDSNTTGYDEVANASANDEKGFEPIGSSEQRFVGTFDGRNRTISNLYINRNLNYVGLFSYVGEGGDIYNLTVADVNITAELHVGGVAGTNGGTLRNISVDGTVRSTSEGNSNSGGLVGENTGTVRRATADVTTSGTEAVGGLVGTNGGTIKYSSANGNVSGSQSVGGLVGVNFARGKTATIEQSSASGDVTGDALVGGLAGQNFKSVLNTSSANGTVTGDSYVGGLAGVAVGGQITDASANATVEGTTSVGGLVGANGAQGQPGSTITNASASGTVSVPDDAEPTEYVAGLVGQMYLGNITRSSASGTVDAPDATHVGGLVGYANGTESNNRRVQTIRESYATGDVTGNESVGGLVGTTRNETVVHSYAVGNVTGDTAVGGLVGNHTGANANVTEAYAAGTVSGGTDVGGLIGTTQASPTVESAYWDTETTAQSSSEAGTGLNTSQLNANESLAGFDFQNTWDIRSGAAVSYPYLRNNTQSPPPGIHELAPTPGAGGDGNDDRDSGQSNEDSSDSNDNSGNGASTSGDSDDDDDDRSNVDVRSMAQPDAAGAQDGESDVAPTSTTGFVVSMRNVDGGEQIAVDFTEQRRPTASQPTDEEAPSTENEETPSGESAPRNVQSDGLVLTVSEEGDYELTVTARDVDVFATAAESGDGDAEPSDGEDTDRGEGESSGEVDLSTDTFDEESTRFVEATSARPVGFITVEHTFDSDDLETATHRLRVRKSYLAATGATAESVALYREEPESYRALSTRRVGEDDAYYYFEADTPGFSTFVIGTEAPIFDLGGPTLEQADVETGVIDASVPVENIGTEPGTYTVRLRGDGVVLAETEVSVPAGEIVEATVRATVPDADGLALTVAGESLGEFTVEDSDADGSERTTDAGVQSTTDAEDATDEPSDTADGSAPGGQFLVLLVAAVWIVVAVWALRRRDEP